MMCFAICKNILFDLALRMDTAVNKMFLFAHVKDEESRPVR